MKERGKLIACYAINNVGKTTQAKKLVDNFSKRANVRAQYLKYARYEIHPSGSHLNDYLRGGNPNEYSPREFQMLQILNRWQYQSQLEDLLNEGFWIVAEDYIGTGLAWGMAAGVNHELLIDLNRNLIVPDVSLYLHGKRHIQSIEKNHVHEENDELIAAALDAHEYLADLFEWTRISADGTIDEVSERLWKAVQPILP